MKNIIISLLFITATINLYSQKDHFNGFYDFNLCVLPIKVYGTTDVGTGNETLIDGYLLTVDPTYEYKEVNGSALNLNLHFGISVPFIAKEKWSIGANISGGLGYIGSLKNAEGLWSYDFDFPVYLYFKNYNKLNYSILIGYKYTFSSLPYSLLVISAEIPIGEKTTVSIYGSPFSYKYWTEYTNGSIKPAIKISNFGITLRQYFGSYN